MEGFSFANEPVLLYLPGRKLILMDVAANIWAEAAPITRRLFRVVGVYGRLSLTLFGRALIRDRSRLQGR